MDAEGKACIKIINYKCRPSPGFQILLMQILKVKNNSERPLDALAVKNITYPLTHNLKLRDASASKKRMSKI